MNIYSVVKPPSPRTNRIIPESYPNEVACFCDYIDVDKLGAIQIQIQINKLFVDKEEFINISSFALVSNRWLKPLSEYISEGKCLEIMARRGVLAKGLYDFGVNIIATDNFSWGWSSHYLWFDVKESDCITAIKEYGENIDFLICCWPYMDDNMYNSLIEMRSQNPMSKLIYFGEGRGGCTANDKFFNVANFIYDNEVFNAASCFFQSWWKIHDGLFLVT